MSIHPHLLCQAKGTKTRSNTDRIGRNNKCKGRCVLTDNPDSPKRCFMDTARSFMSIHPHFVSIVYFRELRPGERAPWHPTNGNNPPKGNFQNQGRFPAIPSKPVPSVSYPKVRRRTASSKSPLYESETGTLCPSAKTTRPFSTADTWFMLTI